MDESGFMLTPLVRRTLAPRGYTPTQYAWDRRDRISAISAITVSPRRRRLRLYFHLLPDNQNVHDTDVIGFLGGLRRHIRRPWTVLWDRGNIHDRSGQVRGFISYHPWIHTEKFPSYAPELNPDEQVWQYGKYERLANFAPVDTHHLRSRIRWELRRLAHRPDLLKSFVRHTGLSLSLSGDH
jgi:transposase